MLELIGVFFATIALLLAILYYSLFPSALNLVVSGFLAWRFGRSALIRLLLFFVFSLTLTFGSRLPDFIADALAEPDRLVVRAPLQLAPGDRLYVVNGRFPAVTHRGAYFSTSGFVGVEFSGGIGEPSFYQEDALSELRRRGVHLIFRPAPAGAPALTIDRSATEAVQKLGARLSQDSTTLSEYERRERLWFSDELGAGDVRHHLLHLTKNTVWNLIAYIAHDSEPRTLTNFLDHAIVMSGNASEMGMTVIEPRLIAQDLRRLNASRLGSSKYTHFDCERRNAASITSSSGRSVIVGTDYELELHWPAAGSSNTEGTRATPARLLRIICGADGHLGLLATNEGAFTVVLTDLDWRPTGALTFVQERLAREQGVLQTLLNLYQQDGELLLEMLLERRKPATEEARYTVMLLRTAHPLLEQDFGSGARRWPGILTAAPPAP